MRRPIGNGLKWVPEIPGLIYPAYGEVYTIRSIVSDGWFCIVELLFNEILNGIDYELLSGTQIVFVRLTREPGFDASEFKPVKRTNIDVFLRMLNPDRFRSKQPVKRIDA